MFPKESLIRRSGLVGIKINPILATNLISMKNKQLLYRRVDSHKKFEKIARLN